MKFKLFAVLLMFQISLAEAAPVEQMVRKLSHSIRSQVTAPAHLFSASPTPAPTPLPALKPIRQGKARIKIEKSVFKQLPNGAYGFETTHLCTVSSAVDVYDGRGINGGWTIDSSSLFTAKCPAVFDGKQVEVGIGSFIAMSTWPLIDPTPEDMKSAIGLMWVAGPSAPTTTWLDQFSATKTLTEKSFILSIRPANAGSISCVSGGTSDPSKPADPPKCTTAHSEYFAATLDIED